MDWQPMNTAPTDGKFYLYGLHVNSRNRHGWFEVWYLAADEEGQLVESSGDRFSTWNYDDFEVWAPAPQPE